MEWLHHTLEHIERALMNAAPTQRHITEPTTRIILLAVFD